VTLRACTKKPALEKLKILPVSMIPTKRPPCPEIHLHTDQMSTRARGRDDHDLPRRAGLYCVSWIAIWRYLNSVYYMHSLSLALATNVIYSLRKNGEVPFDQVHFNQAPWFRQSKPPASRRRPAPGAAAGSRVSAITATQFSGSRQCGYARCRIF